MVLYRELCHKTWSAVAQKSSNFHKFCDNIVATDVFMGSGGGSVGRAVASETRGPWFKSSHHQLLYRTFDYSQLYWTDENKDEKEAGNGPFFKKITPFGSRKKFFCTVPQRWTLTADTLAAREAGASARTCASWTARAQFWTLTVWLEWDKE